MGLDKDRLDYDWYMPTWEGNRARYESGEDTEPLLVEMRPPGYGEARRLAGLIRADGRLPIEEHKRYFLAHIRGLTGLTVGGTAVTTAAELWALGEQNALGPELFAELFEALDRRARLEDGLKKNLSSRSGLPG